MTVIVVFSVLSGAVYISLSQRGKTPVNHSADQDRVSPAQGVEPAQALALKADLAALTACFVRFLDANVPPEAKDRALRQEQIGVALRLHDAFQEDADALFLLAMAYQEQGQSVKAVEHLIQCLRLQADRADAYDQLGCIAQQKGDHEKALALFQEAAVQDQNLAGIHYRLAETLHALGQYPEALAEIEQHTGQNSNAPEGFILKGQISLNLQAYEQAKAAYEKAIQLNPNLTRPYFSLATVCARLGLKEASQAYRNRFKEVEAKQREVAKNERQSFNPLEITLKSVAHTHTDVARIYRAHGKPGQASLLWQRARTLDPGNITCAMELADLLLRSGHLTEALGVYQQIVDVQPNQGVAHFFIGHIHEKLGRWDAAEKAYQQVIDVTPNRPEGYQALARFYLERRSNMSRARALADKAIALNPMAANHYLLAQICDQLGAHDSALIAVERAIEMAPDHMEYHRFYQTIRGLK